MTVLRSAPLAVLCVVVSAAAGLMTFMAIGGYVGQNYGTEMPDGILGLYGGCGFGLVFGLTKVGVGLADSKYN